LRAPSEISDNARMKIAFALLLAGCSASSTVAPPDLATVAPADLRPNCADTFGQALTNGFGRLDGIARAVVAPADPSCAMPNSTHLVLQVDAGGQTYRMVVNVLSDRAVADPRVSLDELDAPLPAPAFAEGWHGGLQLDYATGLGVASTAFTPWEQAALVTKIAAAVEIGTPISVYASTSGGSSAHLVHRNPPAQDGAIVLRAKTSTHWLLFRFDDQTF
jgi:hypothetical protein